MFAHDEGFLACRHPRFPKSSQRPFDRTAVGLGPFRPTTDLVGQLAEVLDQRGLPEQRYAAM